MIVRGFIWVKWIRLVRDFCVDIFERVLLIVVVVLVLFWMVWSVLKSKLVDVILVVVISFILCFLGYECYEEDLL